MENLHHNISFEDISKELKTLTQEVNSLKEAFYTFNSTITKLMTKHSAVIVAELKTTLKPSQEIKFTSSNHFKRQGEYEPEKGTQQSNGKFDIGYLKYE